METFESALRLLRSGQIRKGAEILETVLEKNPEDVNVLYNLGMCYSELGDFDKSIVTLEKCVKLAPEHANALTALGFSYSRKNQNETAVEKFNAALKLDPENFFALKNSGAALAKMGKYDEAISNFEKALKSSPDNPEVLYGIGLAHRERGDQKTADEFFKRIIAENKSPDVTERAMSERREIALETFRSKGFRIDAVMYCLGALELFSSKPRNEILQLVGEIALLGRNGLDINNPEKKYRLKRLPGEFTGQQLVCYMYVGFRILDENVDIGADLSSEYQAAVRLFSNQLDDT
jgi:tetratricopeptide (TPR) repeat protein